MISEPLSLKERHDAIVREHGPWSAHNVEYAPGLFTIGPSIAGQELRLRRVLQVVLDSLGGRPIETVRILDLGCLEGLYALEFARRGAQVVAIDGRAANVAKVNFVKDALRLGSLRVDIDDVRHLSRKAYGTFDVVLCAGILYHLDEPDVFHFLRQIREVTSQFAFFDTHVARRSSVEIAFDGVRYSGEWYQEFAPHESAEAKKKNIWAALDNSKSFWFTKGSLVEALIRSGFSTVAEVVAPLYGPEAPDREMFIAWTSQIVEPLLTPQAKSFPQMDYQSALGPGRIELIDRMASLQSPLAKVRKGLARFKKWLER